MTSIKIKNQIIPIEEYQWAIAEAKRVGQYLTEREKSDVKFIPVSGWYKLFEKK
jgi:hypothetical protein